MASVAKKVTLHGELGKLFGHEHRVAVNSVKEAVRAISVNRGEKLNSYLVGAQERGIAFVVLLDGKPVDEHGVTIPTGVAHIEIAPIIQGAGGWVQVVLGVLLIIVGIVLAFTPLSPLGWGMIGLGLGLVGGGAAALMTPGAPDGLALAPRSLDSNERSFENLTSYAFAGPVNTTSPGQCIPVIYGEVICGSRTVSFGIWNSLNKAHWDEDNQDQVGHHGKH